ncbi:hypothetical protein [Nocardia africana]
MFIDTEELVVAYLQPVNPGFVAVEMPADPPTPFILVTRVAGGDDRITDRGMVQIECFHSSRDAANSLARQMHYSIQQWTAKVGVTLPSTGRAVYIDRIETVQGPHWEPYEDENLKRYLARYEVISRITSSTL